MTKVLKILYTVSSCEVIFRPFTLGSTRLLYLGVHMLLVKEKMQNIYLDIKLRL